MAKKVVDTAARAVSFDFTKDGGAVVNVGLNDLPADIVTRLALHGLSQKVGDSYANSAKQANPLAWAQEQVAAVIKGLKEGIFNAGRTGEGAVRVSMLARALHRIKLAGGDTTSTEADAQEFVDSLTKEQVAEYKAKKKVAKALDAIRLEDAKAKLAAAEKKAAFSAGLDDEDEEEATA